MTQRKTGIRPIFIARYLKDKNFRVRLSLYAGTCINLASSIFHLLACLFYSSIWFGAVAVYYIILTIIRFLLIRSVRFVSIMEIKDDKYIHEIRRYRDTGILLFGLNLAMISVIVQIIWQNKGYHYPGLVIYASAVYAFYSLTLAIINMVKYRKMDEPVFSAAKMLSFSAALMSILTLQTAMISRFGEDDSFRQIMNVTTGTIVSALVFLMAAYMIVRANQAWSRLLEKRRIPVMECAFFYFFICNVFADFFIFWSFA